FVVAPVADLELEHALVVAIRGVFGRHSRAVPLRPHLVLLGLVAGKDHDLGRFSELARKKSTHERAAERTRATRDQDAFTVEHWRFLHTSSLLRRARSPCRASSAAGSRSGPRTDPRPNSGRTSRRRLVRSSSWSRMLH